MHAVVRRSLWLASRNPSRFVAGRRHPTQSLRHFHASPTSNLDIFPWPGQPPAPEEQSRQNELAAKKDAVSERDSLRSNAADTAPSPEAAEKLAAPESDTEKERLFRYSSGLRRSTRNKKPKEIPPINIPAWFLNRNVRLYKYDMPLSESRLDIISHESRDDGGRAVEDASGMTRSDAGGVRAQNEGGVERQSVEYIQDQDISLSREDTRRFVQSIERYISIIRRDAGLNTGELSGTAASELVKEAEVVFVDLRERIRLGRRDATLDLLLQAAEKEIPEFSATIHEFRRKESVAAHMHQNTHRPQRAAGQDQSEITSPSTSTSASTYAPSGDLAQKVSHSVRDGKLKFQKVYSVSKLLMSEVFMSISAGLSPSTPALSNRFPNLKAHLKLLCPIDGALDFLDQVVEEAATRLGADLVRLDAQDLAQIAGDYIQEGSDVASDALWTLGYDTGPYYPPPNESEVENEEDEEDDFAEESPPRSTMASPFGKVESMTAFPVMNVVSMKMSDLQKKLSSAAGIFAPAGFNPKQSTRLNGNGAHAVMLGQNGAQAWNDMKLTALLDSLLQANQLKDDNAVMAANQLPYSIAMALEGKQSHGPPMVPANGYDSMFDDSNKTIVHIRGLRELRATDVGNKIVEKLVELVQRKRADGQQIMLVGASASVEIAPKLSDDAIDTLQAEDVESVFRTLVIMPAVPKSTDSTVTLNELRNSFEWARRSTISRINARHIHNMILRMWANEIDSTLEDWSPFARELFRIDVEGALAIRIMSIDEVHRLVSIAIGQRRLDGYGESSPRLDPKHIKSAIDTVRQSDEAKSIWLEHDQNVQPTKRKLKTSADIRKESLKKNLTRREKALMRGVIDPEKMRTSFGDVHAPAETIEALKTLTTLSLTRPDAFKYGVLATDKISGLLLYGPPGTGKTMLAKAVAKECGATMLEVSGADLWNMYVGEAEKNVSAVFSLAKKLAPCVVFIDEADAIFASRGSGERKSHRELINQFLKEWDGMNETTAFIMVATNRPFDLDDAALRRLPRRILVDLPTEKDREAILGIHLKDECVDDSVSMAKLASQTPLYSGSDLKNIAVAAALAAVREENDEAAKHTGTKQYEFPLTRTLSTRHFDKAMEEISASINEDMSSLSAIKKFDEKYGDRRGRRKKTMYGFVGDPGAKEDTVKVRT